MAHTVYIPIFGQWPSKKGLQQEVSKYLELRIPWNPLHYSGSQLHSYVQFFFFIAVGNFITCDILLIKQEPSDFSKK